LKGNFSAFKVFKFTEKIMATTRKECIKNDELCPSLFTIANNAKADGSAPPYEISALSQVDKYSLSIDIAAIEKGVDAQLIRAIMFMETTHGYYDAPLGLFGWNKSILPMNINVEYWGNTFGTREELMNPLANIKAGAEMIRRIQKNLLDSAIEKIATLYNNINATEVNPYGMRVKKIYEEKPWYELSTPGFDRQILMAQ
jgi:hypothetical protein